VVTLTPASSGGITLSHVLSKVCEAVLLRIYKDYLISDQRQYGFKENSSCATAHALFAVTESVNILQAGDLRYTVDFWMQVKLSTRYCIMVFLRN